MPHSVCLHKIENWTSGILVGVKLTLFSFSWRWASICKWFPNCLIKQKRYVFTSEVYVDTLKTVLLCLFPFLVSKCPNTNHLRDKSCPGSWDTVHHAKKACRQKCEPLSHTVLSSFSSFQDLNPQKQTCSHLGFVPPF